MEFVNGVKKMKTPLILSETQHLTIAQGNVVYSFVVLQNHTNFRIKDFMTANPVIIYQIVAPSSGAILTKSIGENVT